MILGRVMAAVHSGVGRHVQGTGPLAEAGMKPLEEACGAIIPERFPSKLFDFGDKEALQTFLSSLLSHSD
jgi:hypothetical protein